MCMEAFNPYLTRQINYNWDGFHIHGAQPYGLCAQHSHSTVMPSCVIICHLEWSVWVVNALLKGTLIIVFYGCFPIISLVQHFPVSMTKWVYSNTPLKPITFLPPA